MQDSSQLQPQKGSQQISLHPLSSVTVLTPQNVKELFTITLRGGVQKYSRCLSYLGFMDEKGFYEEALLFALLAYNNMVSSMRKMLSYLQGVDEVKFPTVLELNTLEDVDKFYQAIVANEKILGEQAEEHMSTDLSRDEKYLKEYYQRARIRMAGSWAEPASAVVKFKTLVSAATAPSLQQQVLARTAQQEGRDLPGRLAYYLMNTPVTAIASKLVGYDIKEGAGKLRGMAQLGYDIDSAFSDAACHNDARQMCDLLSHHLVSSGKVKVNTPQAEGETIQTILLQIKSCPGSRKVWKITNFANHSAVYLISQTKGTKYESIASPNSTTIMYNDLIRYPVNEIDLEPMVAAGVKAIGPGGAQEIEWEVHEATSLEVLQERLNRRLRDGTTELSMGITIAALEKIEEVKALGGQAKELEKYKLILIPFGVINQGQDERVSLYNYNNALKPSPEFLMEGQSYRMNAQGRWIRVIYKGPAASVDLPTWMNPCCWFQVEAISINYEKPQLREPGQGEKKTNMSTFIFQVLGLKSGWQALANPKGADYPKVYGKYEIVEDPFWDKGLNRFIIYREK